MTGNEHKSLNDGFTIIELAASVAVFLVLVILAGGIMIQVLNTQRKAFNLEEVQSNLDFILEQMAREIRVATLSTNIDTSCPGPSTLSFTHPQLGNVAYTFKNNGFYKTVGVTETQLTSSSIKVNNAFFCINGTVTNDKKQPKVTFVIDIQKGNQLSSRVSLVLQTSLTPRALEQ